MKKSQILMSIAAVVFAIAGAFAATTNVDAFLAKNAYKAGACSTLTSVPDNCSVTNGGVFCTIDGARTYQSTSDCTSAINPFREP